MRQQWEWINLCHKSTNTEGSFPYSTSHAKHWLKNIPFIMARWICRTVENNYLKNRHLRELKENIRTYGYPKNIDEIGIQKALIIPQTELYVSLKKLKITTI